MSIEQQVIRRSELLNRRVIDRGTAEEVGRIEELWLNPKSHHVVGFSCKSGGVLGLVGVKKHSFTWQQIHTIGTDSILVNVNPETEEPEKPEDVTHLINHEVLSDAGNTAGKLEDYILATQTGAVVSYLYKSSGWRGAVDGTYLLSPEDITSVGSKRLIVLDCAVQDPQQDTEGMNQKLNKVGELLQEDYGKTMSDLRGLIKGAQDISDQAKSKVQEVAGQAREGTVSFAEQARDKAQEVADQTRDRVAEMRGEQKTASLAEEPAIEVEVTTPEEPQQPEQQENQ